jgi:hypothetical protein
MYSNVRETKFHGIIYKSRLEARWAVFFESLGIPYQYEPEGFEWGITKYLPDFYLPQQDYFIEVKGSYPDEEALEKGIMLSEATQKDVFLFHGEIPNPSAAEGILESPALLCNERLRSDLIGRNDLFGPPGRYDDVYHYGRLGGPENYYWTGCPKGCSLGFGITNSGRADLLPCKCFDDFYLRLVGQATLVFTAEELRLMWQWASYRYDSLMLRWAYDNARGAWFDKAGNAYFDKSYTPVSFWTDSPLDDGSKKIAQFIDAIHRADDPQLKDKLHNALAQFMLGDIDWQKVGVINHLLKYRKDI